MYFPTYEEIAGELIPYLKENHFNYIEMLPLAEHPADCSWGYQDTGFYAPTARYGAPDGLKKLVDSCHKNDIGVILDFVPIHFAMDDYGLRRFDGTALYEYDNKDVGESEWGTCNFNHSRGEVASFYSPMPITGCRSFILTESAWMRSAAPFTGWETRREG